MTGFKLGEGPAEGENDEEFEARMKTQEKAQEIWDGMDENEQTGVRFGMFPFGKMTAAEEEGYNGKDMAVALMDVAKRNGGMRA